MKGKIIELPRIWDNSIIQGTICKTKKAGIVAYVNSPTGKKRFAKSKSEVILRAYSLFFENDKFWVEVNLFGKPAYILCDDLDFIEQSEVNAAIEKFKRESANKADETVTLDLVRYFSPHIEFDVKGGTPFYSWPTVQMALTRKGVLPGGEKPRLSTNSIYSYEGVAIVKTTWKHEEVFFRYSDVVFDKELKDEIDEALEGHPKRKASALSTINNKGILIKDKRTDVFWSQTGGWFVAENNTGARECARTAVATMASINTKSIVKPSDVAIECKEVSINGKTHARGGSMNAGAYKKEHKGYNIFTFADETKILDAINYELNNGRAVVVKTNGRSEHWVTVIKTTTGENATKFSELMGIDPWYNGGIPPNILVGDSSSLNAEKSGIIVIEGATPGQTDFLDYRIMTINFD
ncbi:MAG: hypothetical protein FWH05_00820 [Oscillospiraceae bacterium]|nr:hypothetical protein [Oscillospiraceae bacterium]